MFIHHPNGFYGQVANLSIGIWWMLGSAGVGIGFGDAFISLDWENWELCESRKILQFSRRTFPHKYSYGLRVFGLKVAIQGVINGKTKQ